MIVKTYNTLLLNKVILMTAKETETGKLLFDYIHTLVAVIGVISCADVKCVLFIFYIKNILYRDFIVIPSRIYQYKIIFYR